MAINGNGINAYLRNMDYRNRIHGKTQNADKKAENEDLIKSGQNQKQEVVYSNEKIKKIEETPEITKLSKKLSNPYGLGHLMDYKI